MPKILNATASEADKGSRLDAFLAASFDISRSAAERLISEGAVEITGGEANKKYRLKGGEQLTLTLPDPTPAEALPEDIPLNIVYEDEDIVVINKPQGMVVHPAPGNYSGTLVNALLFRCRDSLSGIGGVMRPGIVHRIDKDTSGLLVVAKNDFSHAALSEELKYHGIEREYHALVKGGFSADAGTVNEPIGRHPIDRKKMAVLRNSESSREAVTHYEVLGRYGNVSYLKLMLETGRTHQIRVHMSYIGHPLLGDEVYGQSKTPFEKRHSALLSGQALHARRLSLTHPRTGARMTFECPLPQEFSKLLEILEKENT